MPRKKSATPTVPAIQIPRASDLISEALAECVRQAPAAQRACLGQAIEDWLLNYPGAATSETPAAHRTRSLIFTRLLKELGDACG